MRRTEVGLGVVGRRFGCIAAKPLGERVFDLAELRSGIRHGRSVDEITRKEGEAAILWFEHVLRR